MVLTSKLPQPERLSPSPFFCLPSLPSLRGGASGNSWDTGDVSQVGLGLSEVCVAGSVASTRRKAVILGSTVYSRGAASVLVSRLL